MEAYPRYDNQPKTESWAHESVTADYPYTGICMESSAEYTHFTANSNAFLLPTADMAGEVA